MTITHRITTPSTSNTNSYPSGSFTPAVGNLLVVLVTASATVDPGTCTNSAGLSFVRVESALKANSADSLYAFVSTGLVTSAVAQTCTFSCPNDAATGAIVSVLSISGMTLTGYDAIIRAGVQNNGAAVSAPACALGHAALTGNPLIGFVGNATSPATMTPPSGWTEDSDATGFSSPTCGQEVVHINSGFTGSTVTWGGTSATAFGAIVLEFDTSTTAPVSSRPVVGTGLRTDYKWGVDWSTVLALPFNEGSGSTVSGLTMSGTIVGSSWPSGGGFFWNGTDNQIPTSLLGGASEYTIFTKFTPASSGAELTFYYGTNPTGEYYEIVWEILPPYLTFNTRDTSTGLTGARNNDIYTTYTGSSGVLFSAFASYSVSAGYKMQGVNGAIGTGYASNSVDAMTTGWANENIGVNVFYGTYLYGKMDVYVLIKNKALTLCQLAALTANPWLIYDPPTVTPIFPSPIDDTTVLTTSVYDSTTLGYMAVNPANSLIGGYPNNQWYALNGSFPQRFAVKVLSANVINRLYIENAHHFGGYIDYGAKNVNVYGTNDSSPLTTSSLTLLSSVVISAHVGVDSPDPQYFDFINTTGYDWMVLEITSNWGNSGGTALRRVGFQTVAYPSGGKISGSGSPTESTDTASGSGGVLSSGTGGPTEMTDADTGSGVVSLSGSGSPTESSDSDAGSGTVSSGISGSGSSTENADTDSGSGGISLSGTGSSTESTDTNAGTGGVSISGSGASDEGTDTDSGAGGISLSGSGNATDSTDTDSGSGTISVSGSGSPTDSTDASSGSGGVSVSGSGASVESTDASSGAGIISVSGSGSSTDSTDADSGSGTTLTSGSGASTESSDTTSSSGTTSVSGSGASVDSTDATSGSGVISVTGSGSTSESTDTTTGSGTVSVSGSGASTESSDISSGSGSIAVSGSGASAESSDTAAGSGGVSLSGSGASTESTDANSGSGLGNTASRPTGSGILSNWDSIVANVRVGVSDDYSKSLNVQDIVNIISILQGEANTASPLRGILNSHINDKNNPHNVTVAVSDLDLLNVLYTAYGQRFGTTLSFSDFSLAFINLNHFATTTDVDNGTNQNAVVNLSVMEYIVNNHNTSLTAHENMFRNYLPGYPLPFSPSLVVDPLVAIVFPVTVNRNCTMNYHDVNGHVLTAGANTLSADYLYGFPALPIFGPHTNTLLNSKSMSDVVLHNATNNQSSGLLIVTPTIDTTCLILEEDNSNGTHGFVDSITVIPGSNNYSYYYYPISRSQLTISALDSNSNVIGIALYDCTAVTAITNGAMAESVVDIFELPNGWYRCTFAFDASVNPITGFSVDVIDSIDPNNNFNNVYTGTGQNAGAFWQHQLTSTVLPTPPVFTTTTSVSVLGTIYQQAFSGFNQLYGSILVNYISPIPEIFGTSRSVMRIGNNSDNTSAVRFDNDPGNPAQNRIRSYDGNNVVISTFESDPYSGDLAPIKRISYTYSNTVQGYGFTDQVPVVEEVPATLNSATILELGYDSLSDTYLDGYLLSFRYYPIQSTVMNLEFLMAQYVRTNSFIDPSGNVLADPGGDTLIYPGGD